MNLASELFSELTSADSPLHNKVAALGWQKKHLTTSTRVMSSFSVGGYTHTLNIMLCPKAVSDSVKS
jgi:hypothetical protein